MADDDTAPMTDNAAIEQAVRRIGQIARDGKVPGTGYLFRADKVRKVLLDLLLANVPTKGEQ